MPKKQQSNRSRSQAESRTPKTVGSDPAIDSLARLFLAEPSPTVSRPRPLYKVTTTQRKGVDSYQKSKIKTKTKLKRERLDWSDHDNDDDDESSSTENENYTMHKADRPPRTPINKESAKKRKRFRKDDEPRKKPARKGRSGKRSQSKSVLTLDTTDDEDDMGSDEENDAKSQSSRDSSGHESAKDIDSSDNESVRAEQGTLDGADVESDQEDADSSDSGDELESKEKNNYDDILPFNAESESAEDTDVEEVDIKQSSPNRHGGMSEVEVPKNAMSRSISKAAAAKSQDLDFEPDDNDPEPRRRRSPNVFERARKSRSSPKPIETKRLSDADDAMDDSANEQRNRNGRHSSKTTSPIQHLLNSDSEASDDSEGEAAQRIDSKRRFNPDGTMKDAQEEPQQSPRRPVRTAKSGISTKSNKTDETSERVDAMDDGSEDSNSELQSKRSLDRVEDQIESRESPTAKSSADMTNSQSSDDDMKSTKSIAAKVQRQDTADKPSDSKLYAHRPSFFKERPFPASLLHVYDEFMGLGDFDCIPVKGGISSIITVKPPPGKRSYSQKFGGRDHSKLNSVKMLAEALQRKTEETGEPLRTILLDVELQRRAHVRREEESQRQAKLKRPAHVSSSDPFGWTFIKKYVGYGAKSASKADQPPATAAVKPQRRRKVARRATKKQASPEGTPSNVPVASVPKDLPLKPYILSTKVKDWVEESAFACHDPPEDVELWPLPQPPAAPVIPSHLASRWRYDESDNRILHADFKGLSHPIPTEHLEFLRHAMECDYIAVLCDGLLEINNDEAGAHVWARGHIASEIGAAYYYHKFRHFTRKKPGSDVFTEQDGYVYMKAADYIRYLQLREDADTADALGEVIRAQPVPFRFECNNVECKAHGDACPGHTFEDVRDHTLYLMDGELPTFFHRLSVQFSRSFKVPQMLPGSDWCIMNAMTPSTRPFMGPNLYVSPSGGFTHAHQDGHGGVDSGHLCLEGYNEVVLLRRLPERHKHHAVYILNETLESQYTPLYTLPHDNTPENGEKPKWFTTQTIQKWEAMGYAPVCFIVKPGQLIHLNKGRLHAFRKLTRDELPVDDCHYELRKAVVQSLGNRAAPICVSIAWDWNYYGKTPAGINREVASMVEVSQRCRQKKVKSLAPTHRGVLSVGLYTGDEFRRLQQQDDKRIPKMRNLAQGILPSITYIAQREASSFAAANAAAQGRRAYQSGGVYRGHALTQNKEPDIQANPADSSIDARGNDYYCKLCATELANIYYRCDGCEQIRGEDYMICTECFVEGAFLVKEAEEEDEDTEEVDESDKKKCSKKKKGMKGKKGTDAKQPEESVPYVSHLTHCGFLAGNVLGRCERVECAQCHKCKYGSCCSCRCHTNFTMHMRMSTPEEMTTLVQNLKQIAGEPVEHADATLVRLQYGADPVGAIDAMRRCVATMDPVHCKNVPRAIRRAAAKEAKAAAAKNEDVVVNVASL